MASENYVGELNQYAQKHRVPLQIEYLGSDGPDHNKTFRWRVTLDGKTYPVGEGKTKMEAKQDAAEKAWKRLSKGDDQDSVDSDQNATAASAPGHRDSLNYICCLNQYGQINGVNIRPEETTRPERHGTTYYCRFVVGDKEYPMASGKTSRQAKEAAARLVYEEIHGSQSSETTEENSNHVSGQHNAEFQPKLSDVCNSTRSLSLNSSDSGLKEKEINYIGIVNHYCQKTGIECAYIEVGRSGPPHNLRFFFKLKINNKEYDAAEGTSKKEAQQKAARLAWSALQEQSDWDSKVSLRSVESEDDGPSESSGPSTTLDSSEALSHNMSSNTSDSIIFAEPSNHSNAQVSRSIESENNALSRFTGLNAQVSSEPSSQSSQEKQSSAKDPSFENAASNTASSSRFTTDFDDITALGKGGFGRVYKAREKLLGKYCAIKIVRAKKKALREVQALSDLYHRNIVLYRDCWMEDSKYNDGTAADNSSHSDDSPPQYLYIKMELYDKTLSDWIDNMNESNTSHFKRREESLPVARQIVYGVDYIHSQNLIHRDLKPLNIMFGQGGEVKIGDFGLVTAEAADDDKIMKRTITGTRLYMAPEQLTKNTYDQKVDMFALGLIFLELLWKLSAGNGRKQIWNDVRNQKLPKEFSAKFREESAMIYSLLCEKPEDRPKASDLKSSLEKLNELFGPERIMCQDNATV
ncbi:interferon-induced, double-stranded RNA-activated protein kinase-like isoform X1 [Salarias fasciatus]|uniref:Interferon-induced, double-stranded RNA-activated protein kinase-like n=1 Tax=Salarias fasciatus TaxID=181472 RepID=A0A672J9G7_SALFA|nr:interferon-induced, double-stranded RNA-activated protein kinase-like isoform X1 [Salarias fasciatus]